MQPYFFQLTIPLQCIVTIAIRTEKAGTVARESFLTRMYVATKELSDSINLYRHTDREEKLLALKHYLQTDMAIALKEYLQIVCIALTL